MLFLKYIFIWRITQVKLWTSIWNMIMGQSKPVLVKFDRLIINKFGLLQVNYFLVWMKKYYCGPAVHCLGFQGEVIGVVQIVNKKLAQGFSSHDIEVGVIACKLHYVYSYTHYVIRYNKVCFMRRYSPNIWHLLVWDFRMLSNSR